MRNTRVASHNYERDAPHGKTSRKLHSEYRREHAAFLTFWSLPDRDALFYLAEQSTRDSNFGSLGAHDVLGNYALSGDGGVTSVAKRPGIT